MPSRLVVTRWVGLSTMTLTEHLDHRSRQGLALGVVVMVLCWTWLLSGAGTGMRISAMTTWAFPPGAETMAMPKTWSIGYAALMLVMWSTMMWAMMLPALLLDARRNRQSGPLSTPFVVKYMVAWTMFSVAAAALQFVAEYSGWLDNMRMWSVDRVFSSFILGIAALSQLVRFGCARTVPTRPENRFLDGSTYAVGCVATTGPMMLLLFVGGMMNLVWIVGLTVWAITHKRWRFARWHPTASAVICILLTIQIWGS